MTENASDKRTNISLKKNVHAFSDLSAWNTMRKIRSLFVCVIYSVKVKRVNDYVWQKKKKKNISFEQTRIFKYELKQAKSINLPNTKRSPLKMFKLHHNSQPMLNDHCSYWRILFLLRAKNVLNCVKAIYFYNIVYSSIMSLKIPDKHFNVVIEDNYIR